VFSRFQNRAALPGAARLCGSAIYSDSRFYLYLGKKTSASATSARSASSKLFTWHYSPLSAKASAAGYHDDSWDITLAGINEWTRHPRNECRRTWQLNKRLPANVTVTKEATRFGSPVPNRWAAFLTGHDLRRDDRRTCLDANSVRGPRYKQWGWSVNTRLGHSIACFTCQREYVDTRAMAVTIRFVSAFHLPSGVLFDAATCDRRLSVRCGFGRTRCGRGKPSSEVQQFNSSSVTRAAVWTALPGVDRIRPQHGFAPLMNITTVSDFGTSPKTSLSVRVELDFMSWVL